MSLTSAFGAARSGLTTTSRWAETVSENIANANNAAYARRETKITTSSHGAAQISGVARAVDSALDGLYRIETSRTAKQDAIASGLSTYTDLLGDTESNDTILTRLTDFQNALSVLDVTPFDTGAQRSAVTAAQELAGSLNRAGAAIENARTGSRDEIFAETNGVNRALSHVAELNTRVIESVPGSPSQMALQDQITAELDALAERIDFTMRTDTNGQVELFATGGAALLTGNVPQVLSFDADTGVLRAGDVNITPDTTGVRGLSEGALSGKIALYKTVVPQMQAQLDQVARGLIEVMEAADASLYSGEPGLFTDAGQALTDPAAPGLAARISVNARAVPEQGGALWRIRDGLGADVQGADDDNTQVGAFIGAISGAMGFDASAGLGDNQPLSAYVSGLIATQNNTRSQAQSAAQTYAAGAVAIQGQRLSFTGVNVDEELQQLTAIEQSYGANAQVLSVLSEMIDTLLAAAD
ncbi:flagellar hook-associated protein FlgK [Sagittula salina]|uniref:Flagellar hook-associated protein 1 n=1 Tax=Sagittula salina TaxID=2820268 RepID=A0A940MT60_9RHOB|nr:flagellar hook-associated protein FlgK [Sagittula salina]MBP0484582.1 flagellar hook-associated protein FlgK [Sagittula salina]